MLATVLCSKQLSEMVLIDDYISSSIFTFRQPQNGKGRVGGKLKVAEEVNEIIIFGAGNCFVFWTAVGTDADGRLRCRIITEDYCPMTTVPSVMFKLQASVV